MSIKHFKSTKGLSSRSRFLAVRVHFSIWRRDSVWRDFHRYSSCRFRFFPMEETSTSGRERFRPVESAVAALTHKRQANFDAK
jgi:hypothetical protein